MSKTRLCVPGKAAVAAAAALVLTVCASTLFAASAQASPPRYSSLLAGPASQYRTVGFYDTYNDGLVAQCWVETRTVGVLGGQQWSSTNTWLRISWWGMTGFTGDTPFSGVHRLPSTPQCPGIPATCGSSGFPNTIVQWSNGPNTQNTSWYVDYRCQRNWIPDVNTYWCLRQRSVPDRGVQPAARLDSLPDQRGVHAACRQ